MNIAKWSSPKDIEVIIDDYFAKTPEEEITLSGLCIALDSNKQTLANYQEKEDFKHIITMAKMRIENAYERSLRKNGRSGDIFALKNFGWEDRPKKQETDDTASYLSILQQALGIDTTN